MSRPGISALGQGDETFLSALWIQVVGIVLFLPAMMCGLITDEKERGTFQLLMLTDISAWETITQKFLGGLVPMLTLLVLTLPIGGFAYLLGGLTMETVWIGSLSLALFSSSVAAISLACSSYARSTIGAFVGTYFVLGAFYIFARDLFYDVSSSTFDSGFIAFSYTHGMITGITLMLAYQ
jgi:ABC-type transport system involved in multi-copper enzyme maturation permease subunit